MAKPKLTVTFEGKIIGKRSTDRPYTHVVLLNSFDADVYLKAHAAAWPAWSAQCIKNIAWHRKQIEIGAGGTIHVTGSARPWSYQQSQKDYDAHVAYVGDKTDEQLIEQERVAHFKRCEAAADRMAQAGTVVLSWHSSRALACKAREAARPGREHYQLLVHPVDGTGA